MYILPPKSIHGVLDERKDDQMQAYQLEGHLVCILEFDVKKHPWIFLVCGGGSGRLAFVTIFQNPPICYSHLQEASNNGLWLMYSLPTAIITKTLFVLDNALLQDILHPSEPLGRGQ
jgi:hypothetical protein